MIMKVEYITEGKAYKYTGIIHTHKIGNIFYRLIPCALKNINQESRVFINGLEYSVACIALNAVILEVKHR